KLPWVSRHDNSEAIRNELLALPGVTLVSSANAVPGRSGWDGQFAYAEGMPKDKGISIEYIPVGDDYIKTLGLKLVAGRDFINGSQADKEQGLIVNETAVRLFGWRSPDDAIGKKLSTSGIDGQVVGVMKDYHQHGLQRQIGGVVLSPVHYMNLMAIRYEGQDQAALLIKVGRIMEKFFKGHTVQLQWMDDFLNVNIGAKKSSESIFRSLQLFRCSFAALVYWVFRFTVPNSVPKRSAYAKCWGQAFQGWLHINRVS
ncbi:MAG TPA: ABC transporter permease, partial [Phnomibacter sp.]|nr:ABC transporter permease [Phnomibacter sp.]